MTTPGPGQPTARDGNRGELTAADFQAISIDLYITSMCNRRCAYCFLSDEFLNSRTLMSLDTIQSITRWADSRQTPIEEFTLLGGEPALHPDFAAIVGHVAATRFRVRTVTNGSDAFRAALGDRVVAEGLSRVAVSLDGPSADVVDRLRGRGAWDDAVQTIDLLRDLGRPFDINFTVLKSNVDAVLNMIDFAENTGARRLNMHWFSLVGRARKHASDQQLTASEWRSRVLDVVRHYEVVRPANRVRPDYLVDCETAFGFPDYAGSQLNSCAVRDRSNLQFFPSGSVYSCGMVVEENNFSGYVWSNMYGLMPRRESVTELTETARHPVCGGCPMRESFDQYPPVCIYNRLEL